MAAVKVEGVVKKIFFEGKGVSIVETYKAQSGEDYTRTWTAWFVTDPNLAEGDKLSVTGLLSTKIEEFEGQDGKPKQKIALSINNSVVLGDVTKATAVISAPF